VEHPGVCPDQEKPTRIRDRQMKFKQVNGEDAPEGELRSSGGEEEQHTVRQKCSSHFTSGSARKGGIPRPSGKGVSKPKGEEPMRRKNCWIGSGKNARTEVKEKKRLSLVSEQKLCEKASLEKAIWKGEIGKVHV